jgi:hypothetical protein
MQREFLLTDHFISLSGLETAPQFITQMKPNIYEIVLAITTIIWFAMIGLLVLSILTGNQPILIVCLSYWMLHAILLATIVLNEIRLGNLSW